MLLVEDARTTKFDTNAIFDKKIFNSFQNFYNSFDQARAKLSFPFCKSEIRSFFKILRSF